MRIEKYEARLTCDGLDPMRAAEEHVRRVAVEPLLTSWLGPYWSVRDLRRVVLRRHDGGHCRGLGVAACVDAELDGVPLVRSQADVIDVWNAVKSLRLQVTVAWR